MRFRRASEVFDYRKHEPGRPIPGLFLRNLPAPCSEPFAQYLDAFEPLAHKLSAIVLQFPYFKRDTGINLDIFLGRLLPFLDALPEGPRFAVEIRNRDFLRPPLLQGLRDSVPGSP